MKSITSYKQTLRKIVPSTVIAYAVMKREHPDFGIKDVLLKSRLVKGASAKNAPDEFVRQSAKMYRITNIDTSGQYVYPYDSWVGRIVHRKKTMITSVTVDYKTVLESSLEILSKKLQNGGGNTFAIREQEMIDLVLNLKDRIIGLLNTRTDDRSQCIIDYLNVMLDRNPESLDEAIQKLLFYNALFWQAGHWQNGLGRLDTVLASYYDKDMAKGIITRSSAKEMIREMCIILGRDMKAKSRALIGDTGQYILLGGVDQEGSTVQNDLTEIFLEVFTELRVPDPKLILRVNNDTSDKIWRKAIDCILTGCGSPLIINEKKVMDGMVEFGYDAKDVWNFGTSACWEPLIIGKSFDQNNPLLNIPVIDSLNKLMMLDEECTDFDEFLTSFKVLLKQQVLDNIQDVEFDCSPLYSL